MWKLLLPAVFAGLMLSGCSRAPSATQPAAAQGRPQTVIVPQTVVVRETVIVPQTVIAQPAGAERQTVIVRETVRVPETVVVRQTVAVPQTVIVKEAAPRPTLAPASALALSGKGQQATAKFTLPAGLVVFESRHDGKGHFGVKLLNERGELVDLLANVVGTFDGSKAVKIPSAGAYLFDVAADGNWTIKTR